MPRGIELQLLRMELVEPVQGKLPLPRFLKAAEDAVVGNQITCWAGSAVSPKHHDLFNLYSDHLVGYKAFRDFIQEPGGGGLGFGTERGGNRGGASLGCDVSACPPANRWHGATEIPVHRR